MNEHEERLRDSMRGRIDDFIAKTNDQGLWVNLLLNMKIFVDEFAKTILEVNPEPRVLKVLMRHFPGDIATRAAHLLLEQVAANGTVDQEALALFRECGVPDVFEAAMRIRRQQTYLRIQGVHQPQHGDLSRITQRMIDEGRIDFNEAVRRLGHSNTNG